MEDEKEIESYGNRVVYSLGDHGAYIATVHDNDEDQEPRFIAMKPGALMKLAVDIIKAYA